MVRGKVHAALVAAALCAAGAAPGALAADHMDAPLILAEPVENNGNPAIAGANSKAQPQEHDLIDEWRKKTRGLPKQAPRFRPPRTANTPGTSATPNSCARRSPSRRRAVSFSPR